MQSIVDGGPGLIESAKASIVILCVYTAISTKTFTKDIHKYPHPNQP